MRKNRHTTIVDIAKECGLSPTAVSKALNNKGSLRPETVERVLETAKRLNYVPNNFAKSLRLNSSNTIGVIIGDTSYSFFSSAMKGMEARAEESGYDLIFCNTDRLHDKEKHAVETLASKKVSGIVLVASLLLGPQDVEYIKSFSIPVTYIIRYPEGGDFDCVSNDNVKGNHTLTNYLIETGSKKIHYLSLSQDNSSGLNRLLGYKSALKQHGIPYDERLVRTCEPTFEAGCRGVEQWLDSGEQIETLMCGCDMIAVGAMKVLTNRGYAIPGHVRLAGYDDIEFAEYLMTPLTTMRQPQYELGYTGIDVLLNRIKEPSSKPTHVTMDSELVIRGST